MGVDFRAIALFSGYVLYVPAYLIIQLALTVGPTRRWVIFLVLPLTLVIRATVESKYVLGGSPRSQTSAKWITLCIVVAALKLSEKIMPSRWEPQRHIMGNVVIFLVSLDVLSWVS